MFRFTVRVGRVFGVPIEIDASWVVVFLLVGALLSFAYYPLALPFTPLWADVIIGVVTTLVFFASIVVHELCHSVVARHYGMNVERITLFLFGGVSELHDEPSEPHIELLMSLAGPAASIGLGLALFALTLALPAVAPGGVFWVPIQYLAFINLALGLFNLSPGYPMDGGRVVHAYLWWALGDRLKATAAASWAGRIVALLLVALGLWEVAVAGLIGVWPVLLGLFLLRLASQTYAMQVGGLRLANVRADEAVVRPAPTVDANTPVGEAAAAALSRGVPALVVTDGDDVVGVLPTERAASYALAGARAADVALDDRVFFIDASDSLQTAIGRLASGVPALVAVDGGRAVGLSTPDTVAAFAPSAGRRIRR